MSSFFSITFLLEVQPTNLWREYFLLQGGRKKHDTFSQSDCITLLCPLHVTHPICYENHSSMEVKFKHNNIKMFSLKKHPLIIIFRELSLMTATSGFLVDQGFIKTFLIKKNMSSFSMETN